MVGKILGDYLSYRDAGLVWDNVLRNVGRAASFRRGLNLGGWWWLKWLGEVMSIYLPRLSYRQPGS